jgi:hypothetical protein
MCTNPMELGKINGTPDGDIVNGHDACANQGAACRRG